MRGERALLVVVFVVSAALRVVAVDRPLDMDEALWVQRGGAFFGALLEGRLAGTYLRPHPGVVSMWVLGVADLGWCRATADQAVPETWRTCADRVAAEPFPSLPFFIVGRCLQAVLTSAAVAAICLLAGRLFGARVGWLTAAVLALEPFFVGFQRFVTTDALAADLAALAWLLFLRYLGVGGRARLVLSGVAFGMAALTKVPTILIAPALVAWMALVEGGVWPGYAARGWRVRLRDLALWGGVAAATVFVLWPALWVAPLSTIRRFRFDLVVEKSVGSHLFVAPDERPWSFYPLVLLWRLSPFLQVGSLLGLAAMIGRRWRRRVPAAGLEPLALLALSSLLLLRLAGDTARDRYLMFVVPPLAVLSALGWEGLARWLQARTARAAVVPLLVALLALGQSALLLCYAPDYVTYYNPLLGGAAAAGHVLALGQGEGLDRAARWLNRQPGAEMQVVSSGLPWAFAPYFHGRTVPIGMTGGGSGAWLRSDRIVMHVWQAQVGVPDPLSASYIWSQPPLHVIRLHGVDYVRIFRGPIVLPEAMEPMGSP